MELLRHFLHWAADFSPAVARWYNAGRLGSLGKKRFVVSGNYSCHIGHATIVQFDVVFIAYFMLAVMGREVLLEQVKKDLSNVSLYLLAEGWVKPHYIPLSVFPFMGAGWGVVLQPTGMSTSLYSLFNLRDSSGEFLAVVRER